MRWHYLLFITLLVASISSAGEAPRARDLGVPFGGSPGPLNAITDVAGVTVGHATVIEDLDDGRAARTGVTAILPRGRETLMRPVFGAWFALNGCGEMSGTTWLEESGQLEGPVMLTNTHSVGMVHHATIAWRVEQGGPDATGYFWSVPVVAETWDGPLNDVNGFFVKSEHVAAALEGAAPGSVAEGNVGAGTGTRCYDFKCGIGTASRVVDVLGQAYTVGALVQANHGDRSELTIAGVPVGRHIPEDGVERDPDADSEGGSSIIIVVATDAPLLPHQLKRIARRASMGIARNGSIAGNGSGDIFIAFSTANADAGQSGPATSVTMMSNDNMSGLFQATVEATEEAVINAMVAARDMTGDRGHLVKALPHAELREVLRRYGRLIEQDQD